MLDVKPQGHIGCVLVVDDDPDQRWIIENYLGDKGFIVYAAEDGASMRTILKKQFFDIVIMDVGLPGEDGFALTRYLRDNHDAGIIMVTAANELADRVLGLEFGADDYLSKPFEPRELLARIKSIIRRSARSAGNLPDPGQSRDVYEFDEYCLDTRKFLVSKSGEPCFMEPKCIDLLIFLVKNADRVVTKEEVFESVWPARVIAESTLSTLVKQLRKGLGDNGKDQKYIHTVHGRGFRFVGSLSQGE